MPTRRPATINLPGDMCCANMHDPVVVGGLDTSPYQPAGYINFRLLRMTGCTWILTVRHVLMPGVHIPCKHVLMAAVKGAAVVVPDPISCCSDDLPQAKGSSKSVASLELAKASTTTISHSRSQAGFWTEA